MEIIDLRKDNPGIILADLAKNGASIVTLGSFDGVHLGHRYLLNELKQFKIELDHNREIDSGSKDSLSLVVIFEPHPREVLRGIVLPRLSTRSETIEAFRSEGIDVLCILKFDKNLAKKSAEAFIKDILIEKLGMSSLILGYDHSFGRNRDANDEILADLADKYNFRFRRQSVFESDGKVVSSTQIRKLVDAGLIEEITLALGRPYRLSGEIVKGDRKGRSIGFPTANLQIDDTRKLLPKLGVYLVSGRTKNGFSAFGMLNVGKRPTVSSEDIVTIETYFFDTEEDLYGERMTLDLLKRLRDEKKFDSIEELKKQLYQDERDCISYLKTLS